MDFVEDDGDIIMRLESFDVVRRIHMSEGLDDASQPNSRLGYSVGRWEESTLIVRTTGVNWPYFDTNGRVPQSESVEIMERFTLSDDESSLSYDLGVTDPETFSESISLHLEFEWRPDMVVEPYECTLEE